jgi:23S rRNA pseudouridine2457 synthase
MRLWHTIGMTKLVLFNKPFNVLSQFTGKGSLDTTRKTLSEFIQIPSVYAAGRLDRDSEGLLVLTDDGKLQHRISDPKQKMEKCYWVQVEGNPSDGDLEGLRRGLQLQDGMTAPCRAKLMEPPEMLWEREPPVRFRKSVPDRWMEITIKEGRNRQVRRMTAAIGFPTLRLIRYRIGNWTIDGIESGSWIEQSTK